MSSFKNPTYSYNSCLWVYLLSSYITYPYKIEILDTFSSSPIHANEEEIKKNNISHHIAFLGSERNIIPTTQIYLTKLLYLFLQKIIL